MIVKTIKYHDLDGDMREDDFYFSMNETQFARVNAMFPGGLQAFATKAAKDKNADDMFRVIDTLVREAYGERVAQGFVKTAPNGQKLADFFINTEAYDNLLLELMKDENNLIGFMTGCLNKNAQERVANEIKKQREENGGELKIPGTIEPEIANKSNLTVLNPEK